jgi:hypothetical protein
VATEKVSVTLDADLVAELRREVGGGGVSRFMNDSLRTSLQRRRLDHYFAERDEKFGPAPPEVTAESERVVQEALRKLGMEQ